MILPHTFLQTRQADMKWCTQITKATVQNIVNVKPDGAVLFQAYEPDVDVFFLVDCWTICDRFFRLITDGERWQQVISYAVEAPKQPLYRSYTHWIICEKATGKQNQNYCEHLDGIIVEALSSDDQKILREVCRSFASDVA